MAIKFSLSDEAWSYLEGEWDYLLHVDFDLLYADHTLIKHITSLMAFRKDYLSA